MNMLSVLDGTHVTDKSVYNDDTTDIALSYINLNKYEIKAKEVERKPLLTKIKH